MIGVGLLAPPALLSEAIKCARFLRSAVGFVGHP